LKKKVEKKMKNAKKKEKKSEKKESNALWITVVIHSVFWCGETIISTHHLVVSIITCRV
jgi:capsule polysaccharide export protein KpsE/RkpR